MKTFLVILLGILLVSSPIFADGEKPTVIVKSLAASKYLAFGSGGLLDKDPALQTLLLVLYPKGFNFSLWNSTDFQKWNSSLGSEVDYGIGWSGKLGEDFSADIGLTYFDEPNVFTWGAGDIIYGQVKVSRIIVSGFTISGGYERYVTMPHSGFNIGSLYSLGASKNISLLDNELVMKNSLTLVYDKGGTGFDNGFLLRGTILFDWKISDRMTLTLPQVNYYVPLSVHDARKKDAVFFAGLAHRF